MAGSDTDSEYESGAPGPSTKKKLRNFGSLSTKPMNESRGMLTKTIFCYVFLYGLVLVLGHTMPTIIDDLAYRSIFRAFRNHIFDSVGRTSRKTRGIFFQKPFTPTQPFPCDVSQGTSLKKPTSVHKLRPGDIDVIAAMGDSLTAGSGAAANSFLDLFMENRGLAWSIGGQYTWRNVTTLPNILKVFNPMLVGYSLHDSFPYHLDSQFNVAEIGAVSADLPFMAKVLVRRIKMDPRVDFVKSWKMLTICMGGNDFCTFVCTMKDPEKLPQIHRQNLLKTIRYLRDNLPRTFINIVTEPSPHNVVTRKTNTKLCKTINHLECSCFVGTLYNQTAEQLERYRQIHERFSKVEEEVSHYEEFRNLPEFAIVFQPFTRNLSIQPSGGKPDYSLLAFDCFHMSQKGNSWAGTTLWNNLFLKSRQKDTTWISPHKKFLCPTNENPYILTYDNMA